MMKLSKVFCVYVYFPCLIPYQADFSGFFNFTTCTKIISPQVHYLALCWLFICHFIGESILRRKMITMGRHSSNHVSFWMAIKASFMHALDTHKRVQHCLMKRHICLSVKKNHISVRFPCAWCVDPCRLQQYPCHVTFWQRLWSRPSANVSKSNGSSPGWLDPWALCFFMSPPPPSFFLYLLLIFLHPLPCPLTNRLMWRTGMFWGWHFWQLRVEHRAIKGFNWHSWVSHISLKWCENCESPAIIRMLQGGEKMDKAMEDRLVGNGKRNLEE